MRERVGVAISTTGDPHRMDLLGQSIAKWRMALAQTNGWENPDDLIVTIDGDHEACQRVLDAVGYEPVQFWQVGQPQHPYGLGARIDEHVYDKRGGRLGVAANKNTGLELLMDANVDHLFLSDDDTWPLSAHSIDLHVESDLQHSMIAWGQHRLDTVNPAHDYATWTWPRGSVLYVWRRVVQQVGGMDERFGPGGHEHVEWSRRIHQHGLTPAPYCSPIDYAAITRDRGRGMGAAAYWHAEDMQRRGESRATAMSRRRHLTSVKRLPGDEANADRLMAETDGDTRFVPYHADRWSRTSATLYHNH